jgi:hypothetical protein
MVTIIKKEELVRVVDNREKMDCIREQGRARASTDILGENKVSVARQFYGSVREVVSQRGLFGEPSS